MKTNGATLIEVSLAIFIMSLLIHLVITIMIVSANWYTFQGDAITFTDASAGLFNYLRSDIENFPLNMQLKKEPERLFQLFSAGEDSFSFMAGSETIEYRYDREKLKVVRKSPDLTITFGAGILRQFSVSILLMTQDGLIHQIASPEQIAEVSHRLAEQSANPVKIWFNVVVSQSESIETAERFTEFMQFNLFPVNLNRMLNSVSIF